MIHRFKTKWAGGSETAAPAAHFPLLGHDFCSDAPGSVDLQQERVPQAAVDNVDFADARGERFEAGLDLGDHAGVNGPVADEALASLAVRE